MSPSAGERVIVIGPTPPPTHGVSVLADRVVGSLRASGLLAAHLDTRDARSLENLGRLEPTNVRLGVWHALKLVRLLVANPGAAVYLPLSPSRWGFLRDAVFIALARLWRRRVYVHLQGGRGLEDLYSMASPFLRLAIRSTASAVHQAWALTPSLATDCGWLFSPDRVRVVGNVVGDPARATPAVGRSAQAGDGATRGLNVLYLSNLVPEKGGFDLLDAVDLVGERASGWHVRVVGEAPTPSVHAAMLRRASTLRNGVRVDVPGPMTGDAKEREYRWADIFVLPSRYRYEGQPLAILEALAAGLPIVSTFHAGIPDTVRDHEEGMLVAPGDTRALADALATLAAAPSLRTDLGRRARQRYQEGYTPARLNSDLVTLLRDQAPS